MDCSQEIDWSRLQAMLETGRHRGADPEDAKTFGPNRLPVLTQATDDLCWLLNRGYGIGTASELVGDRYHLTRRQRMAVARCSCSREAGESRRSREVAEASLCGQELWLAGFNVLTLVETALGGGVILIGRDGCCRDVAGVYSRYRRVAETLPALRAIGEAAVQWNVPVCRWWLDSPVDNSGRLKRILEEFAAEAGWSWDVQLVTNPDRVLSQSRHIVCSSDHVILDRCERWFNLTRAVIHAHAPGARIVSLAAPAAA